MSFRTLFLAHAYIVLFCWVLVEQLGVPIPSAPLMLTAGTLTATHKLLLMPVLTAIVLGSLISDTIWFYLGKRYGGVVVRLLCRFTPSADACVRRTEGYFGKHGAGALLVSKFIPGLGTMAGAIAGQTRMDLRLFLLCDGAGALLWALVFVVGGRFFGDLLKMHPNALAWFAHSAVAVFLLLFIGFLVNRIVQRRRTLAEIRMDRVTPELLRTMLDRGDPLYIVDLRHPLDYLPDPRTLPGAVVMTPDRLVEMGSTIPRDRDVVLFCTCPNEETAVHMALTVQKLGVTRVRPLLGGFDGWRDLGYPLVAISGVEPPLANLEAS